MKNSTTAADLKRAVAKTFTKQSLMELAGELLAGTALAVVISLFV